MKTLVIYYTLTGNTKFFAERIAASLGGDVTVEEIATFRDMSRYGFLKFLIAGAQQAFGIEPSLMPTENDPVDFDRIFIGAPIWAGRHAPAVNAWLARTPVLGKKVALFASSGDSKPKDWLKRLCTRLEKSNDVIGTLILGEPEKTSVSSGEKIEGWVKRISAECGV